MFGITIDNSQLIEIGLNAVGYLAAGGLSVFLYSALTKRRWRRMFAEIIEQSAEIVARANVRSETVSEARWVDESAPGTEELSAGAPNSQSTQGFVSFAGVEGSRAEDNRAARKGSAVAGAERNRIDGAVTRYREAHESKSNGVTAGGAVAGAYTRNRSEVIRLAKQMLVSGRTSDSVRDELPITESEMRLVELGVRG